jgi:hypothetical protein
MTNITTELSDDLIHAIESYIHDRPDSPSIPAVVQTALQTFLSAEGYLPTPKKRLVITPAERGSGHIDTSITHDLILTQIDGDNPA